MADLKTLFNQRRLAILQDDLGEAKRAILISPAQLVSSAIVNEIAHLTGGLFFVALSRNRAQKLMLTRMSWPRTVLNRSLDNNTLQACISVEAREGVSTGISASDRAVTIGLLGLDQPDPTKLVKPGHIFPVEVRDGGVLIKNDLPEGALDLVIIAGFSDAALFVDLLNESGDLMSPVEQERLSQEREIPLVTLSQLTRFRLETEQLVRRVAEAKLPTKLAGDLRAVIYSTSVHSGEHLALIKGELDPERPVLTRVQPEFPFSDVFGGVNPPTRAQLHNSLRAINSAGQGVLVYLRRPVLGEVSYQVSSWQQEFVFHPAAMMREYGLGAQVLRDLGITRIELLTSSQKNLAGLKPFGIEIVAKRQIPDPMED